MPFGQEILALLLALVLLAVLFALLNRWLSAGSDPARWNPEDHETAIEHCSSGPPSPEHEQAEAYVRKSSPHGGDGSSRRGGLKRIRQAIESVAEGRRFVSEFRPAELEGVDAEWVLPPGYDPNVRLLFIHGGGFIAGSPTSHRSITDALAQKLDAAVLSVNYRLMPENKRKDEIADCREAFSWLLSHGPEGPWPARRLYGAGDSAGGNLLLSVVNWARSNAPRNFDAVVAFSPVVDMTHSGSSIRDNVETDALLGPLVGPLGRLPRWLVHLGFGLANRMRPVNPEVSPLFDDLSGLPPILLQASDSEILYDDSRFFLAGARDSGSPVIMQSWSGLLHVWQIFHPEVPEARDALQRAADFLLEPERFI